MMSSFRLAEVRHYSNWRGPGIFMPPVSTCPQKVQMFIGPLPLAGTINAVGGKPVL